MAAASGADDVVTEHALGQSSSACRHVETAWQCKVRPLGSLKPLRAITAADRIVAIMLPEDRHIDSSTHSWIDVAMPAYASMKATARDLGCPALIVARFDDAVLFVDASKMGPVLMLCGEDNNARVRLPLNRMSRVTAEARW